MAISAVRAVREMHLTVLRDVSVVGFDDIDLVMHTDPRLTTVHQQVRRKGEEAARLLLAVTDLGTASRAEHRRLDTRLIVFGSTATAPVRQKEVAGVRD